MRTMMAAVYLLIACATTACQGPTVDAPAPAMAGAENGDAAAMEKLLSYVQSQNTSGFLVIRNGVTLVERNWSPPSDPLFDLFRYEVNGQGELLEDVASQQKSFVAVLVGIAVDKGLIDVDQPVNRYLGAGWSGASPEQEAKIRVANLLAMNSGLNEKLEYEAPAGTRFFYNTPAYAISKRILTAASGMSLDAITATWLTEPLAMADTRWRKRPAALGNVGNDTGLVTTPGDTARFGTMVLHGGVGPHGSRILSKEQLHRMFVPSATNPAYGRLWWLNGSDHVVRAGDVQRDGPLIAAAPSDLVAALGFLDRRLYVVPSLDLVVVRTGAKTPDADFDEQLWQRLMPIVR